MEKEMNQLEQTVNSGDTIYKPAPGTCPTCLSGVDPTIGTGAEFQSALHDAL